MLNRLNNLQKVLKTRKLDGFIVTNPFNIFYLTGFRGVSPNEREAILIISSNCAVLITARLYQQEALKLKSKSLDVKIADERNEINKFLKDAFGQVGGQISKIGFEEHDLKFLEFKEFKKLLKGKKLVAVKHLVEEQRAIKSDDEIKYIETAQKISQKAFEQIVKTLKVGQREAEIAQKLAKIIKSLGADDLAFEPIVAAGKNSAKPHYVIGKKKIKTGEVLLFDFGAKYKNYCADLSRTIFIGGARDEQRNIYHHVQNAQNMAIAQIAAGVKVKHTHNAVNKHFKAQNLEQNFLHSLGHGVGLEIHEKPHLGKKSKDTLSESMVFSIEPGLYFPLWGGIRIEDLVTIQNGKAKILGKTAEFIQLD